MLSPESDPRAPARTMDCARGCFRSVVTDLEMTAPPEFSPLSPPAPGVTVQPWAEPPVDDYLALFRQVGDPWLWYGRLRASRADIADLLQHPGHEVWRLWHGPSVAGLCELDRRLPGETEIAYFGLVPDFIGRGLGGYFLRTMLAEAWRGEVRRVWLHTCTEDHPDALTVYQRIGFRPYQSREEWVRDPRLDGLLPRHAGPHVEIPEAS